MPLMERHALRLEKSAPMVAGIYEELHERGVPVDGVEVAFVLAEPPRLIRPVRAAPLGAIRSLAYFVPVIEEVRLLQVGPEYFQYLR